MRIFSVIFFIMILVAVNTAAYGGGGFIPDLGLILNGGPIWFDVPHQTAPPGPPNGFWFKPDADREQLKQDYSECRGKGGSSCMREKGYFWLTGCTGFWYKVGTTQEQIVQDYSECRNTIREGFKREGSCMKEKGYTWASYYGE